MKKPTTYPTVLLTLGSLDLSFESAFPGYVRCAPGLSSLEVQLPSADTVVDERITIRNHGETQDVLVNPTGSGQTIEGSTDTYRIDPGERVTLQAIHYGGTTYGWEIVGI